MAHQGIQSLSSDVTGKISPGLMQRIIYPNLGANRKEVMVGPAAGRDTCVIELGSDQVLVASTDPLSLIPQLGVEESAWMSINLLVNDLSTSGLKPKYIMVDLNLPPDLSNEALSSYWRAISRECQRLDIAIIGGNTGKFEGCGLTIVGSGTIFTTGSKRGVISSSGAKLGDHVIVTKGAAISTTGLLSKMFPIFVTEKLDSKIQKKSAAYFWKITGFNDAQIATSFGGKSVTAIHDVAEGGVLSSLIEMAQASAVGMKIHRSKIPVSHETESICGLFGIDPYWSLGEGAMLIASSPRVSEKVLSGLNASGITAAVVGEIVEKSRGIFFADQPGPEITRPKSDPYWSAYYKAVQKKWE